MMREDGGVGRLRRERMVVFVSLKTHPLEQYSSMELSDKGPNALPQPFPRDSTPPISISARRMGKERPSRWSRDVSC